MDEKIITDMCQGLKNDPTQVWDVIIQLYQHVITTNEPKTGQLVDKMLNAFRIAIREKARLERDRAKRVPVKGAKT